MDKFKELQNKICCGPGGIYCPCCNIFYGKKSTRRIMNKNVRSKLKQLLNKELKELA
jgi:hypothetical protein